LFKEHHGRFKKYWSISLLSIKDKYNDSNSELQKKWVAFFPTKVEGKSLCKSLENVSAITFRWPST
jgi:hypothetical protein